MKLILAFIIGAVLGVGITYGVTAVKRDQFAKTVELLERLEGKVNSLSKELRSVNEDRRSIQSERDHLRAEKDTLVRRLDDEMKLRKFAESNFRRSRCHPTASKGSLKRTYLRG